MHAPPPTAHPRLRRDLRRSPRPDGEGALLLDPDTGAMLVFSAAATALLEHLDGTRTLEDAARAAAVSLDEARAVLEALREHLVLDDDASVRRRRALLLHRVERARIARGQLRIGPAGVAPDDLEVAVREGLRWSCIGCGACCSGRFSVQLGPRDEATLRALDLEAALGLTLDDALVWPAPAPLPGERPWLRTRDGRCVFLGRDGLCDVHRRFGADAKPEACRAFPFEPMRTPDGALLRYRPECSGQSRTAASGAPVDAARARETYRALAAAADGVLEVPDAPLVVRASRSLDWPATRALWHQIDAALAGHGWRAGLTALREATREPAEPGDERPIDAGRRPIDAAERLAEHPSDRNTIDAGECPIVPGRNPGEPGVDAEECAIDPAPQALECVLLLEVARRRAFDQLVGVQATTPLRGLLGEDAADEATAAALVHGSFEALRAALGPAAPAWPRHQGRGADALDPLRVPRALPELAPDATETAQAVASMQELAREPAASAVLTRYLRDAVAGQYVLHAETIAAGAGLLALVVSAALASAVWAHLARGRALDAASLNEAVVMWHLQVFGHVALRVDLQLELRDVLERLSVELLPAP